MANQYIVAKRENAETNGLIGISVKVFEAIAELAIEDIKGVKVVRSTNLKKSVNCEVKDNITIDMRLACQVGVNVNSISTEVQNKVAEAIKNNTDFDNIVVNVNIVSFYTK